MVHCSTVEERVNIIGLALAQAVALFYWLYAFMLSLSGYESYSNPFRQVKAFHQN